MKITYESKIPLEWNHPIHVAKRAASNPKRATKLKEYLIRIQDGTRDKRRVYDAAENHTIGEI